MTELGLGSRTVSGSLKPVRCLLGNELDQTQGTVGVPTGQEVGVHMVSPHPAPPAQTRMDKRAGTCSSPTASWLLPPPLSLPWARVQEMSRHTSWDPGRTLDAPVPLVSTVMWPLPALARGLGPQVRGCGCQEVTPRLAARCPWYLSTVPAATHGAARICSLPDGPAASFLLLRCPSVGSTPHPAAPTLLSPCDCTCTRQLPTHT